MLEQDRQFFCYWQPQTVSANQRINEITDEELLERLLISNMLYSLYNDYQHVARKLVRLDYKFDLLPSLLLRCGNGLETPEKRKVVLQHVKRNIKLNTETQLFSALSSLAVLKAQNSTSYESALSDTFEHFPNSLTLIYELAKRSCYTNHFLEAIHYLELAALCLDPTNIPKKLELASLYVYATRWKPALNLVQSILTSEPDNLIAQLLYLKIYRHIDKLESSVEKIRGSETKTYDDDTANALTMNASMISHHLQCVFDSKQRKTDNKNAICWINALSNVALSVGGD